MVTKNRTPKTELYSVVGSLSCAMVRAGSRRFGRVEPSRTHVKLHHRSGGNRISGMPL